MFFQSPFCYTLIQHFHEIGNADFSIELSLKPSVVHNNLIQLSIRRFLLSLHLPFALKARKDPHFYFSRKVCLEQALIISMPQPDEDFKQLISLGGGMFREIMTLGAFGLCLELISQLEEDSVNLSVGINRAQRKPYRDAIKAVVDIAEERLQLGETNIKGYLFLSMALGQIDAMENGEVIEEGIYKAAKESATKGYEILNSRLAWRIPVSDAGRNAPGSQGDILLPNGAANGMMEDQPITNNVDFNFEELASWLCPTTDEIPWASLENFPTDFQV